MEASTSRKNICRDPAGHRFEGPWLRWVSSSTFQREHEARGHYWDDDCVHPIACRLSSITRRYVNAKKGNLQSGSELDCLLKYNHDEHNTANQLRTHHIPPTGVANKNNRATNCKKTMTTKYNVASRRMTLQRVVIPKDLSGNSLLTLYTMIEKAVISITSRRETF